MEITKERKRSVEGYSLKKIAEGTIHPDKLVTHRFGLSELEKGFHIMRDKTEDYGKILMVNE